MTKLRNVHTKARLDFCLRRFHLITSEANAFSKLCKYSLLKKSQDCQLISVDEFYSKKLLLKCFGQIKLSQSRTSKVFRKISVTRFDNIF